MADHDLLDASPIFDIKPYLTYSDSFPDATQGWLEDLKPYKVSYEETALEQIQWLQEKLHLNLLSILNEQLGYEPTNTKTKRVKPHQDGFRYAYKTWRFDFKVHDNTVEVFNIISGYSPTELGESNDLYQDKFLHKEFLSRFS